MMECFYGLASVDTCSCFSATVSAGGRGCTTETSAFHQIKRSPGGVRDELAPPLALADQEQHALGRAERLKLNPPELPGAPALFGEGQCETGSAAGTEGHTLLGNLHQREHR